MIFKGFPLFSERTKIFQTVSKTFFVLQNIIQHIQIFQFSFPYTCATKDIIARY